MLNELLTGVFYCILSLPYLTSMHFSQSYISFICIRVILIALVLSVCANLIVSCINVFEYFKIRKQRGKIPRVIPGQMKDIQHHEESENYSFHINRCEISEVSVAHQDENNEDNEDYFLQAKGCRVSFCSVTPYNEENISEVNSRRVSFCPVTPYDEENISEVNSPRVSFTSVIPYNEEFPNHE